MLSFFWWNVSFFYFLCFNIFFWFTSLSNFISYVISNQIYSRFYSFLNYSFWCSFCSIYSCFCCSINLLLNIFITKFSGKWQKAIFFNIFSRFWFGCISHFYNVYPIISVKLTLSVFSSVLLIWSVNQTST